MCLQSYDTPLRGSKTGLHARLCDVRAACQRDAAQMVVFTALQSEYLLQPTGLADPTVTANGTVGKQTVVMRLYLSNEAAENHFTQNHGGVKQPKVVLRRCVH